MRKSFVPILLLFAISIQSVGVMAGKKVAKKDKTPTQIVKLEELKIRSNYSETNKINPTAHLLLIAKKRYWFSNFPESDELEFLDSEAEIKKAIERLVKQNANINDQTMSTKNNTPLHTAVNNIRGKVVEVLLKMPGIDLSLKNNKDRTAFQKAQQHRKEFEKIERLFEVKEMSPIDRLFLIAKERVIIDDDGKVKKTKSVEDVIAVIKNLQRQGVDIYLSKDSKKGNTPLYIAVNNRRLTVVQALLQIAEDEGKLTEIISMGSKGEPGKGKTPIEKAKKRMKIYQKIKDALEEAQEKITKIEEKERDKPKQAMFNASNNLIKAYKELKLAPYARKEGGNDKRKALLIAHNNSKIAFENRVKEFVDTLDYSEAFKLETALLFYTTEEETRLKDEYIKQLGFGNRWKLLTEALQERVRSLNPRVLK